jgi:hypothetical protein
MRSSSHWHFVVPQGDKMPSREVSQSSGPRTGRWAFHFDRLVLLGLCRLVVRAELGLSEVDAGEPITPSAICWSSQRQICARRCARIKHAGTVTLSLSDIERPRGSAVGEHMPSIQLRVRRIH